VDRVSPADLPKFERRFTAALSARPQKVDPGLDDAGIWRLLVRVRAEALLERGRIHDSPRSGAAGFGEGRQPQCACVQKSAASATKRSPDSTSDRHPVPQRTHFASGRKQSRLRPPARAAAQTA
jgi:hypothetical protein